MSASAHTPVQRSGADASLDTIADEAADWLVRLHGGGKLASVEAALNDWLARDTRHVQVWQEMAGHLAPAFSCIRDIDRRAKGQTALARRILSPALPASRRRLLVLGLAGVGMALLADRVAPLRDLTAEYHTRTGERRRFVLEDGSSLTLAPRSAANMSMNQERRALKLCGGAAVVEPHAERRPFLLADEGGVVRATGRFLLERIDQGLLVAALGHGVELEHRSGQRLALSLNEVGILADSGVRRRPGSARTLAAWTHGMLDVPDGTLGDVIDALRPWRSGVLRISEAARRLPVFGVFQLDDINATLDALAASLPIKLWRAGSLFASIDLR